MNFYFNGFLVEQDHGDREISGPHKDSAFLF